MRQAAGLSVSLRGVEVQRGRDVRLRYADASLPAGAQVAVVGPSGTGKTTLLHVIAGLLLPHMGEVHCGGTALHRLGESRRDAFRRQYVGYVFQEFHLMDGLTALENVELGLRVTGRPHPEKQARETLELLELGGRLTHKPAQLSTGEKQRVALARAVAHRPGLLLADEPTAHLDSARAGTAVELLSHVASELGATLIMVTHDPLAAGALATQWPLAAHLAPPMAAPSEATQ